MTIKLINKRIKRLENKKKRINDKIGKLKLKRYNKQTEMDLRLMRVKKAELEQIQGKSRVRKKG